MNGCTVQAPLAPNLKPSWSYCLCFARQQSHRPCTDTALGFFVGTHGFFQQTCNDGTLIPGNATNPVYDLPVVQRAKCQTIHDVSHFTYLKRWFSPQQVWFSHLESRFSHFSMVVSHLFTHYWTDELTITYDSFPFKHVFPTFFLHFPGFFHVFPIFFRVKNGRTQRFVRAKAPAPSIWSFNIAMENHHV